MKRKSTKPNSINASHTMQAYTPKELDGINKRKASFTLALGGAGVLKVAGYATVEDDIHKHKDDLHPYFHYQILPYLEYLCHTFNVRVLLMADGEAMRELITLYGYSHILHDDPVLKQHRNAGDREKGKRLAKWKAQNEVKNILAVTTTNYGEFGENEIQYINPSDFRSGDSPKLVLEAVEKFVLPTKTKKAPRSKVTTGTKRIAKKFGGKVEQPKSKRVAKKK